MSNKDLKIHTTITHKRHQKPKFTFKAVISGLLISTTMLSTAVSVPTNAFAYSTQDLDTSIATTTAFELSQFRELTKQNIIDVAQLKQLYSTLSDLQNKASDDSFIRMIAQTSQSLDLLDIDNMTPISGTIEEAKNYYGKSISLKNTLASRITFSDIKAGAWYENNVKNAAALGIISGKGNNTFDPQGNLTVAEAITLVANTRAYFNDELPELTAKTSTGHWVQKYADYIKAQGISSSDFSSQYDTSITRGAMADLFAYALPDEEYDCKRDFSTAPEQVNNPNVQKLYESGIMSGDNEGFRLNDNITRAEVSALINRLIVPEDRDFKVPDKVETPSVEAPNQGTQTSGTSDIGKIAENHKTWYVTPSWHGNNQQISANYFEGSSPINTIYNHTYNCANQQEYDAVIAAIKEAYNAVTSGNYTPKQFAVKRFDADYEKLMNGTMTQKELKKRGWQHIVATFPNDLEKQSNIIQAIRTWKLINDYITVNYPAPANIDTSKQTQTSAYQKIFKTSLEGVTCEGGAAYYMAIWDVMGYNVAAYGSTQGNHQQEAVQFYGIWMCAFTDSVWRTVDYIQQNEYSDFTLDIYATDSDTLQGAWIVKR